MGPGWGGGERQSATPDSEKFAKNREKEGNIGKKQEKSGRKGKNREGSFTQWRNSYGLRVGKPAGTPA